MMTVNFIFFKYIGVHTAKCIHPRMNKDLNRRKDPKEGIFAANSEINQCRKLSGVLFVNKILCVPNILTRVLICCPNCYLYAVLIATTAQEPNYQLGLMEHLMDNYGRGYARPVRDGNTPTKIIFRIILGQLIEMVGFYVLVTLITQYIQYCYN